MLTGQVGSLPPSAHTAPMAGAGAGLLQGPTAHSRCLILVLLLLLLLELLPVLGPGGVSEGLQVVLAAAGGLQDRCLVTWARPGLLLL